MQSTIEQLDSLREIINIGVGRGADVLNTMLNSHISLQVPFVKVLSKEELEEEMKGHEKNQLSVVRLGFKGNTSGSSELIFTSESASKLITAFTGEESESFDLDSIRAGTLTEIGNIVLNAVVGSISNMLNLHLKYSVPNYMEGNTKNLFPKDIDSDSVILLAKTRFKIEEFKIEGDIALFFELGGFDLLLNSIDKFENSGGQN